VSPECEVVGLKPGRESQRQRAGLQHSAREQRVQLGDSRDRHRFQLFAVVGHPHGAVAAHHEIDVVRGELQTERRVVAGRRLLAVLRPRAAERKAVGGNGRVCP